MSRKHILITLIFLLTALVGCQKEDTAINLKPRSSYLDAEAGSTFIAVTATWDWTLTLEYPDGNGGWASVEPASGSGSREDVRLRYEANTSEDVRSVTVVLTPGKGASARVTLTQSGKGSGNVMGKYGYDVAGAIDWLELPAMVQGDGRELLIHNSDGGKYTGKNKDGVRNWSCYWDFDDHLSLWVAYPLNNKIKGSGTGRTEAWGYDALIPQNLQPSLINNSYGGGWTRGHQIPSADRQRNYAENASTYVSTNMTPQQYDFNGGIWASLEGRVRDYASKADTLYVVTGCLFDKSTQYSGNNSGFAVKVPTQYFKALLYKGSASAASATGGYLAVGYILPHNKGIAGGNFLDYICSVDELEKQTGIDFFPNLAKRVGQETADAVEAQEPSSFWK